MTPQMPPVVQFSLPTPGQQPQQQDTTPTPSIPGMPPVAQFSLPGSEQTQTPDTSYAAFQQNLPLGEKILQGGVAPQQGGDTVTGILKGVGSLAQSADVLDTMKKMAGEPTSLQSLGVTDPNVFTPTTPEQQAAVTGTNIAALATPLPEAAAIPGVLSTALKGATDPVVDAVMPRLTPQVAAETATETKGLLQKIVPTTTKQIQKVADAVRPYFNPKATWSANASAADKAIGDLADQTEAYIKANDHPVVIREITSAIKKAEEPISLKGTSFEKQITPLKNAFAKILRGNGGTLSGTFKSLRDFDNYVERTWPTLWDRENAPMRSAVTSLRNTVKDYIESGLPKDSPYKGLLEQQSNLFDARDTFREKAALGPKTTQGEIGTTNIQRFGMRHPGLLQVARQAKNAALLGTAGYTGYDIAQKLGL